MTTTPLSGALRACLRSGDRLLREAAISRIEAVMREHGGNATRTARALGVSSRALFRWMSEDPELARLASDLRAKG